MKRTRTIIGVRDVAGSFNWYQSLFGQPGTPPGHDHFAQVLDTDGPCCSASTSGAPTSIPP